MGGRCATHVLGVERDHDGRALVRRSMQIDAAADLLDALAHSLDGARLVLTDPISTPDAIDLYIPQKEQTFSARVAWRNGVELGVEFAHHKAQNDASDDGNLASRVAHLESEIITLKRIVKQLKEQAGPAMEAG